MTFDARSLLAVAAALAIALGMIVLSLERRLSRAVPGLRLWAVADFALGAAASLHLLAGIAPAWIPALAGNALVLVARAAEIAALRQFDQRRAFAPLLSASSVLLVLALAALVFAWPSVPGRGIVAAGGAGLLSLAAAMSLAMGARASVSRCMAMLGFLGLALAHLSGAWLAPSLPGAPGSGTPDGAAAIGGLLVLDVLCNVGYLLMITDRVNDWVLQLARTDALTGVLARATLAGQAQRDLLRARRQGTCTAVFLVDIDGFRAINARAGSAAGDAVLRHVAQHGQSVLRCTDLFGRQGGDEFIAVLPDTDVRTAAAIAERLRLAVAEPTPGVASDLPPISVSIGVAAVAGGAAGLDDLVAQADAALREARREGGDQTRSADGAPAPARTPLRLIRGGRPGQAP
jgi:diguanylate cyclase (GGDEF)-like protein